MQSPRNLRVYHRSLELAVVLYDLSARFPVSERYGLVAQMRRAAVSLGSNIAEGCGRQGNRAPIAALHHSPGSLDELEFQAELSRKLGFCDEEACEVGSRELLAMRRSIAALISALRKRPDTPEN